MKKNRLLWILLITNAVSASLLFFIAYREHYFTKNRYTLSIPYTVQRDFFSMYKDSSAIVMLGSSYTSRIYWNELLRRPDVANRGIDADITEGYISRMDDVLKLHPKICFIEGGRNDIFNHVQTDAIIANLKNIVQILRKENIIPVLTTVVHNNTRYITNITAFNEKVDELNVQIRKLAAEDHIALIDLYGEIAATHLDIKEFLQTDGIHFNSNVYKIWRRQIDEILIKENI